MPLTRYNTLTEAFDANLRDDRHVIFIEAESDERSLSFRQLHQRALGLLGQLQKAGLGQGDQLALFLPDNQVFLEMFWACQFGGIVAVPVSMGASDAHREKLIRILGQLERGWLCTDGRIMSAMAAHAESAGMADKFAQLKKRTVLVDQIGDISEPGRRAQVSADDIAFIQFSSGSTSEPKGVMLSHRNVSTNIWSIASASRYTDNDISLSWMPLTHDMGLIGFHLNEIAYGITHYLMRTDLFARQPLLWISKASDKRATMLCSPNFGYFLYLREMAKAPPVSLDLSAIRLIYNGAEPISSRISKAFLDALEKYGLKRGSLLTVYGLAEASVGVSIPPHDREFQQIYVDRTRLRVGEPAQPVDPHHPNAVSFVRVGHPIPATEVRIVDGSDTPLSEAMVGHVQVRGDNVTRGYYRNETATATAILADGWVRTGDLGLFSEGELVITGRSKDVIFVNGQNYYPHDLELVASDVRGIELNKVVICGTRGATEDSEHLLVFIQFRGKMKDFVPLVRDVRRFINLKTGLEVAQVIPVQRIPKTTSGKLQRYQLKNAYEQGEFAREIAELEVLLPAAESAGRPSTDTERLLKDVCDRVIPEKAIGIHDNLFEINITSIKLARFHEEIEKVYPELEVTVLFDYPTLAQLAAYLDRSQPQA